MSADERVFWRGGACCVWVKYTEAGELEFVGQDLAAFGQQGYEYEYFINVAPDQFPALREALGVSADADVLEVVCSHVDHIMPAGERTWLERHGIVNSLSTWHSPPD